MLTTLGKWTVAVSANYYNFERSVKQLSLRKHCSLTFHPGISLTEINPKIYVQFQ